MISDRIIRLSVIIPAYNVEKYIVRCVESVEAQDIVDAEILCINDASSDGTGGILKELSDKYSNITVITNEENRGLSFCRNRGIEIAHGEYLLFVDADDFIEENVLGSLYGCVKKEALDVLYFDYVHEYETEEDMIRYEKDYMTAPDVCCEIMSGEEYFIECSKKNAFRSMSWLGLYNTSYIRDNRILFYNGILHEDNLYYPEVTIRASRIKYVPQKIYHYLKRTGTIMTNTQMEARKLRDLVIVCAELERLKYELSIGDECYSELMRYIKNHRSIFHSRYEDLLRKRTDYKIEFRLPEHSWEFECLFPELNNRYSPLISYDSINKIKNANDVIIYGAGRVAKEIIEDLHNNGIDKFGIAVTELKSEQYIYGSKVREIKEYQSLKDTALILVAVAEKYQNEVLSLLDSLGFMERINMLE